MSFTDRQLGEINYCYLTHAVLIIESSVNHKQTRLGTKEQKQAQSIIHPSFLIVQNFDICCTDQIRKFEFKFKELFLFLLYDKQEDQ